MIRVGSIPLGFTLALCLTSSCKPRGEIRSSAVATADTGCAGFRAPIRRERGSISSERACSYVRSAFEALSLAKPESVLLGPTDTAVVSSATVDAIGEIDSGGNPVASWWLVTLHLGGKPYDAEVRFNQRTGERSIRPVHK